MGSSIVVHWSCGQCRDVKLRDDNGFQDVPLISCPSKIALNSHHIHLVIMRNVSPHHHRTTVKWNGFIEVGGGIGGTLLPQHTSFSIIHVQKKAAFIGLMNLSPQHNILSDTMPNVLLCGLVSEMALLGILISQDPAAGKGVTSNKS